MKSEELAVGAALMEPQVGASLTLSDVTKRFGGVAAVSELSLQIAPGELLGVIGPNGAGKSTLLSMVNAAQHPTHGEIVLDGKHQIHRMRTHQAARLGIARAHQIPRPFPRMSVRENLLVASHSTGKHGSAQRGRVDAILEECGLPDGVLNLITSSQAGPTTAPLIADQRLRKLSFTGSTQVGRLLMSQASETLLRLSMELGGNAPFVVFEDADIDAAVQGAVLAKMRNVGEACTAANRFHVHESVADEFSRKLAARLGAMKIGRGTEEGVEVGPLVDAKQRDKVAELVEDAVGRGAKVLTGGSALDGRGYFYEATVLSEVPDGSQVLTEEIFGPVAPIRTFADEDEAVAAANASEYGLASYLFTRDFKRALRVSERLETGMIGLNQGLVSNPAAPFGGIKQSGFGREGGHEGINEYLETKYIAINMD